MKAIMNTHYINIGTEKCCFFVPLSTFLLKRLEQHPLLYYAMEEAVKCAQAGYYSAGIIIFAQLLNVFNEGTPDGRHKVAHSVLKERPTREAYDAIVAQVLKIAKKIQNSEISKYPDTKAFELEIGEKWNFFMTKMSENRNSEN